MRIIIINTYNFYLTKYNVPTQTKHIKMHLTQKNTQNQKYFKNINNKDYNKNNGNGDGEGFFTY